MQQDTPAPAPLAHRIEDAVRLSGLSRTRLYAALRTGEIEAVKVGKATLVLDESLRRWLAGLPRYAA